MKRIESVLEKKFEYKLEDYKICEKKRNKNIYLIISLVLFVLLVLMYFIQDTVLNIHLFDFLVVIFGFFVFVLIPLGFKKGNRFELLLITPEGLVQRLSKNKVTYIPYDMIKKFKSNDGKSITIFSEKSSISISIDETEEIGTIIDILESKGKTFDKKRDFMIRPVEIKIFDNIVSVIDIKREETETEKIVGKYLKIYPMLTPGYLSHIILMNSIVERAYVEGDNFIIKLNVIGIKEGHPENIKFESQIARDCILIIEKADVESIVRQSADNKDDSKEIQITLATLGKQLSKSVISDWRSEKGIIFIEFSVGVNILQVTLGYNEIIVGWKAFK